MATLWQRRKRKKLERKLNKQIKAQKTEITDLKQENQRIEAGKKQAEKVAVVANQSEIQPDLQPTDQQTEVNTVQVQTETIASAQQPTQPEQVVPMRSVETEGQTVVTAPKAEIPVGATAAETSPPVKASVSTEVGTRLTQDIDPAETAPNIVKTVENQGELKTNSPETYEQIKDQERQPELIKGTSQSGGVSGSGGSGAGLGGQGSNASSSQNLYKQSQIQPQNQNVYDGAKGSNKSKNIAITVVIVLAITALTAIIIF